MKEASFGLFVPSCLSVTWFNQEVLLESQEENEEAKRGASEIYEISNF